MRTLQFVVAATVFTAACRPDAGVPDYSMDQNIRYDAGSIPTLDAGGLDPRQPRLFVGIGYEGRSTEQILIDNEDVRLDIFDTNNDGTGTLTFSLVPALSRVEGTFSDAIVHAGTGFWGGGIFVEEPRDILLYRAFYISLNSTDPAFATVNIAVQSLDPDTEEITEAIVRANDYGYRNDGAWHSVVVPMSDFIAQGFDAAQVVAPWILAGGAGAPGERLLVDNIYYQ